MVNERGLITRSGRAWIVYSILGAAISYLSAAAWGADWPCYRGPNKNGRTSERITRWPPKELWRANVGQGYSCVVVSEGRVYAVGWNSNTDTVYCFNETSLGTNPTPRWTQSYASSSGDSGYPGARATPTADGSELYTFSADARLGCYNKATGDVLWSTNLNASGRPGYGYASSPLVEGNLVIVNVGTNGTAVNKSTGAVVWGNGSGWAGYASPWAFTRGTQRTVVVHSQYRCYGVNPLNGTNLWGISWTLGVSDPILCGDRIWVRESYGGSGNTAVVNLGSGTLSVNGEPGEWSSTVNMCNGENCQVLYDGHVYGPSSGGFRCIEFATGTQKWVTPGGMFYMESSAIIAQDQLVIMAGGGPNGNLVVARATPDSYQEVMRANGIISGDTWSAPTLANGRLYLRSQDGTLICFDVNADRENDGIADEWENRYFGGTNNCSPTADADNDGLNNLEEFIAGTNPTNAASRLEVSIVWSNGQMVVSYPSLLASGPGYEAFSRYYSMESRTNLLLGDWQPVPGGTNIPATGGTKTFTNASPADMECYRVKVWLQ